MPISLRRCDTVNDIIANLVFATRLESGAITLNRQWTTVEEVIGVGLARHREQLARRPFRVHLPADLPMILILTGVIGGLIAFGMIGLFIGPVLLAVSWRLYDAWVHEVPPPPKDPDVVLEELSELEAGRK